MLRTPLLLLPLLVTGCGTVAPPSPAAAPVAEPRLPSSAVLALLPDGEYRRRFITDCTGCHQFGMAEAFPGGRARSESEWRGIVERMVSMAGPTSSFPVISGYRDAGETAAWLAGHLASPPVGYPSSPESRGTVEVTEFVYPHPADLPHDVGVDRDGHVVVTGMFTHRMLRLDPATGNWQEYPIPVEGANPRALEIDGAGDWWVLLGAANRVARYRPGTGEWTSWEIGMYGHSIRLDARGRAWFNGHFTRDPELIGYVEPATGGVRTYAVPSTAATRAGAGPIPYGLRIAADGTVWGTELQGNRLFRFDPATERFATWDLPTSASGPRRPEVARDGTLWIPQYGASAIASFEPVSERFTEYRLPIPAAAPYVIREGADGRLWIGTGAADAVLAYFPRESRFEVYPLPTAGALIRHLDVDPRTGDVWVAYGASPGIAPKVARLRPRH